MADAIKKDAGVKQGPVAGANEIDDKAAKFKEQKKLAAERFKERRAAEKKERHEKAVAFVQYIKDQKIYDKLSADLKSFVDGLVVEKKASGNGGLFAALFGAAPKVGDSITLRKAFELTTKGKSTLDFYVKRWAEKGIVVKYTANAANILDSTYTIEKL